MKPNEGKFDRVIRLVIGAVALFAGLFVFTGVVKTISLVVAAVGIITGLTGFCGLYSLLGISTCPVKKN